jgi:hypothetical protein
MYLKTDKIIITLGDIILQSKNIIATPYQFILDPTAIVGWTDGVDARRETAPRPTSGGDFAEDAQSGARSITVTGAAIASTPAQLKEMRDMFVGVLADGKYKEMSLQDNVGTRFSTVGQEGIPSWVQKSDTAAVWRMGLYAPDPHVYSQERSIQVNEIAYLGGLNYPLSYPLSYNRPGVQLSQLITNNGNVESWPKFVVTGEFPQGFVISYNNRTIHFSGMVTMTSPVTINSRLGNAVQNGVDRSTLLTSREWFSIPPKTTIQPSFTSVQNGPGWCDIIYRDTWI